MKCVVKQELVIYPFVIWIIKSCREFFQTNLYYQFIYNGLIHNGKVQNSYSSHTGKVICIANS